jgi:hypothetical protein
MCVQRANLVLPSQLLQSPESGDRLSVDRDDNEDDEEDELVFIISVLIIL